MKKTISIFLVLLLFMFYGCGEKQIKTPTNAMEKFEKSGAWNLPVIEDNKYLGFVSKARIFNAYRKRLIRQKQD